MNKLKANANRTMFLVKVCQFVSFITSPKHPQSDTGLKITRSSVKAVNKRRRYRANFAASRAFKFTNRVAPRMNSISDITPIIGIDKDFKNSRFTEFRYSLKTIEEPIGSIILNTPESINIAPIKSLKYFTR